MVGPRPPLQLAPLWLFLVCCGRVDVGSACACGQNGIKNNRWDGGVYGYKGLKLEEACPVSHTFIVKGVGWGSEGLTFPEDPGLHDCEGWLWSNISHSAFKLLSTLIWLLVFGCFVFERSVNFKIWYNYKYWPKDVLFRDKARWGVTPQESPALWRWRQKDQGYRSLSDTQQV